MNGYMNGYKIEKFNEISSTNDYIKEKRENRENLIVLARMQTGGKGTKGRSFSSNEGGVYLSMLTFHEQFPAKDAFLIMARAAVAVVETLVYFGIEGKIKWANDVFVNDKKICGILIENVFLKTMLDSSIVGIGLNVYNALPDELSSIATTMEQATGKRFAVEEVEEKLIENLLKNYTMEAYCARLGYMGKDCILLVGDEEKRVKLLSVESDGALWVEHNGKREKYYSAEVSLRF